MFLQYKMENNEEYYETSSIHTVTLKLHAI